MANDEADRWAIHIDIEGFGVLYDRHDDVLLALGALMEGIYLAGSRFFPESPNRLFAHQVGDGFIIVSEHGADSLEVPVSLSVALLRHVAASGRFAKAAVAEGALADIQACFPTVVREAHREDSYRLRMGRGIMNTFPVMGSALIRAVGVTKKASGALLIADNANRNRLPAGVSVCELPSDVISIDWLHADLPLVTAIKTKASLSAPSVADLEASLREYCTSQHLCPCWKSNTLTSLGLAHDTSMQRPREERAGRQV